MGIARGVLLGLEERVKVPEGRLDKVVGRHLAEAHPQQDLAELGADLTHGTAPDGAKGRKKMRRERVERGRVSVCAYVCE